MIFTSHTTSARPPRGAAKGKRSAWDRAHTLARGLTSLHLSFPHLQSGKPPFPHRGVCLTPRGPEEWEPWVHPPSSNELWRRRRAQARCCSRTL